MIAAHRLLPDMTPERESLALEKFGLVRRRAALIARAEECDRCGWDSTPIHAEIGRCERALGVIDQLLAIQHL